MSRFERDVSVLNVLHTISRESSDSRLAPATTYFVGIEILAFHAIPTLQIFNRVEKPAEDVVTFHVRRVNFEFKCFCIDLVAAYHPYILRQHFR